MNKTSLRWVAPLMVLALVIGISGCGNVSQKVQDNVTSQINNQLSQNSDNSRQDAVLPNDAAYNLPQGFPSEIPLYKDAKIIEADNFNQNHYTLLYTVSTDYDKVVDFYVDAFNLDHSGVGESECYFEGVDLGDICLNGLTIEQIGENVNVFITLEDYRQEGSEDEMVSGEEASSDIVTYDTAQEVPLDKNYPQHIVPIHPGSKVIGCSMVPNTSSGFIDLILPSDAFENAVSFYTEKLSLTPKTSTTPVQEAASFNGEINNIKVSILITHLLRDGNDTWVQITVNEK